MGECESCHIFVIDKCIICLCIQIYNNNNNILKPCMTYNSVENYLICRVFFFTDCDNDKNLKNNQMRIIFVTM